MVWARATWLLKTEVLKCSPADFLLGNQSQTASISEMDERKMSEMQKCFSLLLIFKGTNTA